MNKKVIKQLKPQSEQQVQTSIMRWARLKQGEHPPLELLHAIPNGSQRHRIVAAKLKGEGVKAGVPDLHLPVPRGKYASLYIELKTEDRRPKRGGKGGVSDKQEWWIEALTNYGNKVIVAYGFDEAVKGIEEYLIERKR